MIHEAAVSVKVYNDSGALQFELIDLVTVYVDEYAASVVCLTILVKTAALEKRNMFFTKFSLK